jgi:hypothetical protein
LERRRVIERSGARGRRFELSENAAATKVEGPLRVKSGLSLT